MPVNGLDGIADFLRGERRDVAGGFMTTVISPRYSGCSALILPSFKAQRVQESGEFVENIYYIVNVQYSIMV